MIPKPKIFAPASKSYLQRALIIATLAKGRSVLRNVTWCDDTLAVKRVIQQLGAKVSEEGRDIIIESNGIETGDKRFNVGESGLALRMLSPVLALSGENIVLNGKGTLINRPTGIIEEALQQLGIKVKSDNGSLPLSVKGPLSPGEIEIDGSLSSQVLTGLLIALPLAGGDSQIKVPNLKSRPYVDMTLEIMSRFGVEVSNDNYQTFNVPGNQKYWPTGYNIEGDWSGAAFMLVAGALKGEVEVLNLDYNSKQADKRIVDALESAGAKVKIKENSVVVEKCNLISFEFDATDCPDLFPPLVCLASMCTGESVIRGASRLKHKESNRAEALQDEFAKIGIRIELENDLMKIYGSEIKGGTIDSRGDHRIAMAAGVMNLVSKSDIKIEGKEAVNKSYPDFFAHLETLK